MKDLVKFFHDIGTLKEIPRRGWVIRDIKNPESIADHILEHHLWHGFWALKKKD